MKRVACLLITASMLTACPDPKATNGTAPKKQPPSKVGRTWVPVWRTVSTLHEAREGLAVVEADGYLFAIGGAREAAFSKTVERAKIADDGSFEAWAPATSMVEERGYFDAVVYQGFIYAVGGAHGPHGSEVLRSVERAKILGSGALGPWELEKHELTTPRRYARLVLTGDTLYAIGGSDQNALDTIEHTKLLPGGGTSAWVADSEHTAVVRYVSSVMKVGDVVILAGSHDVSTGAGTPLVEWSKIGADGTLGPWQLTNELIAPRFGLGLALHGTRLYAIGGLSGPKHLDSIEWTDVLSAGGTVPWQESTTKLLTPRAMMGIVVYKDWIYSIGGSSSRPEGGIRIDRASFNDQGEIGSWMTPKEIVEHKEYEAKLAATKRLPFRGEILERKAAPPYVYLKVKKRGDEELWIAGPNGDYAVGTQIQFGHGQFMKDFYSKQLDVKFPTVLFVQDILKVEKETETEANPATEPSSTPP